MAHRVLLKLFGTFELQVNGQLARFKRRKSELLVAYLALHPGAHMREKLASLFWGDTTDQDARRTLRVTLTDMRQVLGEDALPGDRDSLSLHPEICTQVDVNQFNTLLQRNLAAAPTSNLLAALELYRGDLLDGYYDDWLAPLRSDHRSAVFSALRTLAERARAAGQYAQAAMYASRMLGMEPRDESGLQHLLFALAANGEKERALEALKKFETQDGMELSRETLSLIRQIREQAQPGAARLSNLPRPLTSFIGREDELNAIETLLTRHRLVTLLGPGGSGKTRLAIQAGDEISHEYPGGVWWVDFSPLTEARLVPQVISKTIGAREQAGVTFLQVAAALIGDRKTLLLLDNCEHVLSACAQSVSTLLADCPQLSVLTTSREPLDITGEYGWQVPALPLPGADQTLKSLRRNEAVRLFVERGRNANPSFELTETTAAPIVQICRRLDGIPLALELAATLLRVIPVADVAARLARQFEALRLLDDQRPPRQQTLRALIDWSYNLLTPAEQIFFRRLGVFAGGWSFEAAMTVAGGYTSESPPSAASGGPLLPLPISATDIVYGLLDSLKRRSLITVTHTEGVTRYQMLETLREFALVRCAEHHELEALRARHLKEILRLAEMMEDQLSSGTADQVDVLGRFDPEVDNARSALGWALRDGDLQDGLLLGAAVYRYWSVRQMYAEIREWLEKLCSHPHGRHPTRARGYALARYALSLRNDPQRRFTIDLTEEAASIFTALGDDEGLAHTRFAEGETLLNYGDIQRAEPSLLQALPYFRAHPKNVQTLSALLASLARIQLGRRQFEQAYAYVHDSLALSEASRADLATGWNLLLLGDIAFHLDDLPLAEQHYRRALDLYLPLNRLGNIAYLKEALAAVAFARDDLPCALQRVEESLAAYAGYGGHSTFSRAYRAAIAHAQGDLKTARAWLQLAVNDLTEVELEYRAMYLVRLAEYATAQSMPAESATLFALTLQLETDPHTVLFPPEVRAARAGLEAQRAALTSQAYHAAVEHANTLTFEEAVALVLQG